VGKTYFEAMNTTLASVVVLARFGGGEQESVEEDASLGTVANEPTQSCTGRTCSNDVNFNKEDASLGSGFANT